ncbi:MAG TPA: helix-turn-helix domain-containing protein [Coriobacteriia bacterium]|jgi:addiction module HigA family antidote
MATSKGYRYVPDVVSAPGETLREVLEDRGISQADFATRLGKTEKFVSQLINGKAPISPQTALDLQRVLGVSAAFWNNAEALYRGYLARKAEEEELAKSAQWAKRFPLKAMADNKWVARETSQAEQAEELLSFFGVASPDAWEQYWSSPKRLAARMTKAFEPDTVALSAWLRRGELEAEQIETGPFEPKAFESVLRELRALTREPVELWQEALREQCAAVGVAVVFVPELPKIRCHAVSRWLSPAKALIQLCLRYKTDDQLWFGFFHEAAHLLKHGKKRTFISDIDPDSAEEAEANRFAGDLLIPAGEYRDFLLGHEPSRERVTAFAEQLGIAPSIVVGRLQHDGYVPFSQMNDLKQKLEWAQ